MPKFIIYFNQQWVGDHTPEWFQSRGPLARKVVEEMREAGVLVFAGGLEEEIENSRGFDTISYELDKTYFDIMSKRIKNHSI